MKTKVLHISQSLGGVETYMREIVSNIDKEKFDLEFITPEGEDLNFTKFCSSYGIKVNHVKMVRGFNPFYDFVALIEIINLIRKFSPDLLHLHSSKAGFLGRIASKVSGVKSLFTPNGVSYLSFVGIKRSIFFLIEVFLKPFTDRILTVSYSEANRLIYEVGHKPDCIDVVLNSISVDSLNSVNDKDTFYNESKIRIGTIARITPQKNPLLFVEIAKEVIDNFQNVDFYLLGAGLHDHLRSEFEEKIKNYGIEDRINIIDWGTYKNGGEFIKSIDIFILPSVFEGLPFSLLEAMILGKPCVTSKCDGCIDTIIPSINGYTCGSFIEYISILKELILSVNERERVGVNAINHIKKFHNSAINIKLIEAIYLKFR